MNSLMLAVFVALSGEWQTLADADVIYRIIPACEQNDTILIMATSGGVVYFDLSSKKVLEQYTNTEGLLGVVVNDIEIDSNGVLWAISRGHGMSFKLPDRDEFTPYPPSMFPRSVNAMDIEVAPDGKLLVATDYGLYVLDNRGTYENFDDDIQTEISRTRGFPFDGDTVVSVDVRNDTVYIATMSGVFYADYRRITSFDAWRTYPMDSTGLEGRELTLVRKTETYFVIGSDRGLFVSTPDTSVTLFTDESLWSRVNDCFEGDDGYLYVATQRRSWHYRGGGVWRISSHGNTQPLGVLSGLEEGFVWGQFATTVSKCGDELVAGFGWGTYVNYTNYGAGLGIYDSIGDRWREYHIGSLWFNSPAFVLAHGDVVWMVMRGGSTYPVYLFGIGKDTIYAQTPRYRLKAAFSAAVDSRGFVWVGIFGGSATPDSMLGILVFDSTARFVGQIHATTMPIIDMTFSKGDTLYYCVAQYGTYRLWAEWDGDSIISYTSEPVDIEVLDPVDIDVDRFNRLWIGTQGRGVKIIDLNTGESYWLTESNGLPGNYINMFKADENGMWVCTKSGLAYFEGDNPPTTYLQGEDVSSVAPSADGRLWVVTSDRVLVLRPESRTVEQQFTPGVHSLPDIPNPNYKTEVVSVRNAQGDVWIATTNGVGVFKPAPLQTYITIPKPYVYPNPYQKALGSDFVTVVDVPVDAKIELFTLSGEKLPTNIVRRDRAVYIDVSGLAEGLYFIVITHGNEVSRLKLAVR